VQYIHQGGGINIETNGCENDRSFFSIMYSFIVVEASFNVWNDQQREISDIWDLCTLKRVGCGPSGPEGAPAVTELRYNHVDGLLGTIAPEIKNLWALQSFQSFSNNKLSGSVPSEVSLLGNLVELDIRDSSVSGVVPSSFGRLSSLKTLRLYETKLKGSMPDEICSLVYSGTLTVLEADCVMLECSCCTKCLGQEGAVPVL
jgi:hypothetical protein